MTAENPPPLKPLSPQGWESLIDDFQNGGPRLHKWAVPHLIPPLLDHALSALLKKDFPLKIPLILLLEEFSETFFSHESHLDNILDAVRAAVQAPLDGVHVTYLLKEQFLVSVTSIFISVDVLNKFHARYVEDLVELLLTVVNRPNHGSDRQTRAVACECLRELEKCYPCLLSEIAAHMWSLCQSERTHACQCYFLLFTNVVYNIVDRKLSISVLNSSVPWVPFNVPQWFFSSNSGNKEVAMCSNYKDLRKAMAFLLESPQVFTPCGMVEFLGMIMPVAVSLELQSSMLKVQFFGMIYSFDPLLCHLVLVMYSHCLDAFDGQEGEIVKRLMLISTETQHFLVFRLLALHWLLGLVSSLILRGEIEKYKSVVEMGLRFYPAVFDPLALKALKLDLLAFCSIYLDHLKSEVSSGDEVGAEMLVIKLFEDGLVSVSAFRWLPPWSSETAVAFRAFYKFLIGASSHSDIDHSTTTSLMDFASFHSLQGILVDLMMVFQRLVPVIVSLIDRMLGCQKHHWLGERLLQKIDEFLLSKVKIDYKLVSYFPLFDRIAENNTIPPSGLLDLLLKFIAFLIETHGPDTGFKSWSQGSKVLGICRTMLMNHHSSRLFLRLSQLLAFISLYFPDLEVRDNSRIYLRMLICIPGKKLRGILNLGEQLHGISPSSHSSSFFNVQSPRRHQNFKKSRSLSSYIHLERVIPLLVKQCWSLSLSPLSVGSGKPSYPESIRDSEPQFDLSELDDGTNFQSSLKTERINQPQEPLRVMDSKNSEILATLRRHFSCIPDFRHMPGIKVRIACYLRFESEPFSHIWGVGSQSSQLDGEDALHAMYATVIKFLSSAPYGSIPSYHIPFLLGEPLKNNDISGLKGSLDIVPLQNGSEEESFRAPVTIDLEPQEPTPGLVDVIIEANAENGQIINGQLQSMAVGIEDMFLKAITPPDILEDAIPSYYAELFDSLWEACGSSNTGRETFPLKGGKGLAAISGTQSVKLLEVPPNSLVQATEQYLAPYIVSVIGEQLVSMAKDGGIIRNVIWKDGLLDPLSDGSSLIPNFRRGPLHLTYIDDDEGENDCGSQINTCKRNIGCFLILIFLPPRFHLLFQMEVGDLSTLVRIRTDHWPCLAYVDDYLEALYLA